MFFFKEYKDIRQINLELILKFPKFQEGVFFITLPNVSLFLFLVGTTEDEKTLMLIRVVPGNTRQGSS